MSSPVAWESYSRYVSVLLLLWVFIGGDRAGIGVPLVWSVVGVSRYELKELGFEFVLGDFWLLLPGVYRYAVRIAL